MKESPAGSGKVVEIGDQIHLGAMVFMKIEYSRLALFCLVYIIALSLSDLGWNSAFSFVIGTVGYTGMYAASVRLPPNITRCISRIDYRLLWRLCYGSHCCCNGAARSFIFNLKTELSTATQKLDILRDTRASLINVMAIVRLIIAPLLI